MTTYFAMGLIGNVCGCIVFLKQSHHRTPCSIYLLNLSIFANIYLIWSIVPRIYAINHTDLQNISLVYCKLRLYGSHITGLYIRFLIVFACADRYFITRTSVRIRSWSSNKMAVKLVVITFLVCAVIGLHLPIFMEIRNDVCSSFGTYKFFYATYQCIVIGIVPPTLMSIFGFLTIRSLGQLHSNQTNVRKKDRDLMRMLVAEIMINVATSIPYSANLLYSAATFFVVNKSAQHLEIDSFCETISQVLINMVGFTPFYLFILSSKSFRHEFTEILINWWYKCILRRGRIVPFNR
jgi:hypothetical protein